MSAKAPEEVIIRAIHEAFIKYPEGEIGAGYRLVDTASRPGMSGTPVIRYSWAAPLLTDDAVFRPILTNPVIVGFSFCS